VIQIDIDPTELGRSYPNCVGLFGDALAVSEQILGAVKTKKRPEWIREGQSYVDKVFSQQRQLWTLNDQPIRSERLCHEVSKVLADDAILVADTGWSAVWSATMIRMKASQMYTRAAGSLGWSFPASLGVKCGAPDRQVVNFTGDGAFFYLNPEIETAVRRDIKTVTVINNNNSLSQCIPFAMGHYPGERERCSNRFSFSNPNFTKIAEGYGMWAKRVERAEDIAPTLAEALAAGKPALVEVMTDHDQAGPLTAWED
jgi:acetolactate synthase-1/2/3 large subunit